MKYKSFKEALQDAGLSVKQFSELTHTPIRTVYHWANGERRIPGIVFKLLEILKEQRNQI